MLYHTPMPKHLPNRTALWYSIREVVHFSTERHIVNLRIASKFAPHREIPSPRGVSLHVASPRLEHIMAKKANQLYACTFVRQGSSPAPLQADSFTPAAANLARTVMEAIGTRQDGDSRICRLLPSERPDYDICITFWPEDEEMYQRVYRAVVGYIKPADVSAGAITYEVS